MKLRIIIEFILVLLILVWILPHWNKSTTTGDLFCLEIVAMLVYNIYECLKKKICQMKK